MTRRSIAISIASAVAGGVILTAAPVQAATVPHEWTCTLRPDGASVQCAARYWVKAPNKYKARTEIQQRLPWQWQQVTGRGDPAALVGFGEGPNAKGRYLVRALWTAQVGPKDSWVGSLTSK